jgi:hypothetical protein
MTDIAQPDDAAPATDASPDAQPGLFDLATTSDEVTITDMAAEMDTSVPADAAVVPDPAVVDDPDITGICRGGPYDGRRVPCRFSGGFVLYDKQRRLMWTYATDADRPGEFIVRSNGAPAKVTDVDKLREAAEGVQLDVIAYDDGPAVA